MKARILLAVLLLLLPSATVAQAPLQSGATAMLKPGDVIRITVWRQQELSGEFDLALDGSVKHPIFREVTLGGLTVPAAEAKLRVFLQRFEAEPSFVIEPLFRVALSGEVRRPDLYTFSAEVTLSQAVARAGGPTERGRMNRVRLLRGGSAAIVDLTLPESGDVRFRVQSGDQIVVERSSAVFREYIAPIAAITGAAAAVLNVALRR